MTRGTHKPGSRYYLARCANRACPAHLDGYKLRMTRIHVELHGTPLCPRCRSALTYEGRARAAAA